MSPRGINRLIEKVKKASGINFSTHPRSFYIISHKIMTSPSHLENSVHWCLEEVRTDTHFGNDHQMETLKCAVIDILIDETADYNTADTNLYLEQLKEFGCESGTVDHLVYYGDTHAFYDSHYNAVESIRHDLN